MIPQLQQSQGRKQQPAGRTAEAPLRVLVLHQHYWPEIAATAQILSDICEDLAAAGHEVTVVCGQPSYRGPASLGELPSAEVHRGVRIRRVWSYTPDVRTIPKRLAHYASYFASSLASILLEARPDVCLVMSTPPLLLGVSGTLGRLLRGIPFVYSVQDLYPDIAVHLGVIRERGVVARVAEQVASACYQSASALVALSDGMATRLSAKGVSRDRIHVIPNWSDTASVRPHERQSEFARANGLAGSFVVQYSGNLGLSQGLESVLAAAELVQDLPIKFAFVGDGNARPSLEKLAKERALKNVCFLPPQPRDKLGMLLGSCDVGLVTMKRGVGNDLVPSKLYGIMAAQRPVIASVEEGSEVANVVRRHECGWVVPPESPAELAEGIREAFAASGHERERRALNARTCCEEHYAREVLTQRYEAVLKTVGYAHRARR